MKTKILKPLLAMACLLSSINVSAYDFEVDGIYYDVVSLSELTCKVVWGNDRYSGDVVIPAHVNYANRTFTVVEIKDKAFALSKELTGITIPNTITSIGNNMFYDCTKLERVKIEDGETVLKLGYTEWMQGGEIVSQGSLFYECPLTSLYVGRNLSYTSDNKHGNSPFQNIKTLKDLTIGNSVTKIGAFAFYYCSGLTSIIIPNSVTEIGSWAFYNCSGLTSVTIPNSVTKIGSYTFCDCSGLTSVTIPNSVTKIGYFAFSYCSGLTSLIIPESVTSVGDYNIVHNCTALTALYILNTTPPTIKEDYFDAKQYMALNVFVPQEALPAYQSAVGWKNFWNMQGFAPTGIDNVKNDIMDGNSRCYDLRGNRLSVPKRGLNIINGKKVIVK